MNINAWCGPRIVLMTGKMIIVKYAWICAHVPVNEKEKKGMNEMRLWKEILLEHCLKRFAGERRLLLFRDIQSTPYL